MEYELPEPGERVCEPAGILEPCSRADVVRDGEAGDIEVLESGEYPTPRLNNLVLIVLVSMGSIEEGGAQVRPLVVLLSTPEIVLIVLPNPELVFSWKGSRGVPNFSSCFDALAIKGTIWVCGRLYTYVFSFTHVSDYKSSGEDRQGPEDVPFSRPKAVETASYAVSSIPVRKPDKESIGGVRLIDVLKEKGSKRVRISCSEPS